MAWAYSCYWFEDFLGYVGRFVHGTKKIHNGFCFGVNSIELLAEKNNDNWILIGKNYSINLQTNHQNGKLTQIMKILFFEIADSCIIK
jgi:hypothetical protein